MKTRIIRVIFSRDDAIAGSSLHGASSAVS
jgi:hypothetical protein